MMLAADEALFHVMKNDLPLHACDFQISLTINYELTWPGLIISTAGNLHYLPICLAVIYMHKKMIPNLNQCQTTYLQC